MGPTDDHRSSFSLRTFFIGARTKSELRRNSCSGNARPCHDANQNRSSHPRLGAFLVKSCFAEWNRKSWRCLVHRYPKPKMKLNELSYHFKVHLSGSEWAGLEHDSNPFACSIFIGNSLAKGVISWKKVFSVRSQAQRASAFVIAGLQDGTNTTCFLSGLFRFAPSNMSLVCL